MPLQVSSCIIFEGDLYYNHGYPFLGLYDCPPEDGKIFLNLVCQCFNLLPSIFSCTAACNNCDFIRSDSVRSYWYVDYVDCISQERSPVRMKVAALLEVNGFITRGIFRHGIPQFSCSVSLSPPFCFQRPLPL